MVTISNDEISATINFHGAELSSLKNCTYGTEYLWQADPTYWKRHAPVLFPIVGRLRDDEYIYDGMNYHLSQHGFARDMPFELIEQSGASAVLSLRSSSQTLMVYPFKFELVISYELVEKKLIVSFEVINKDHKQLLFSIGAHPAFKCPLEENENRSEYFLKFSSQENARRQLLVDGLRTGETEELLLSEQVLVISDDLFEKDALVFEDLTSSMITLSNARRDILSVHFDGFPYLGIWSKDLRSPFICIEPWYGVADTAVHNHQLSEKQGINKLEENSSFKCQYIIELH